ncbi:MAG TPA: calcium-binding protein, partial [Candidatus Poseidoniales archaeon]
ALDTDGDGVADSLESANGTNINNPDTDGDGEDDRTELEQDTNPNT